MTIALSHPKSNLSVAFNPKKNSLGFLRFIFAVFVVLQHSYVLGKFGNDPLASLSNGQVSLGALAVHGFFIMSGFLITRSYLSISNIWRYLWHRILRIFPGFWVCLLCTALIFAPIIYIKNHGSLIGYFSASNSPISYFLQNLFLFIKQPDIAQITSSHNEQSLNGSLWTLEWEFKLYLAIGFLGWLSILKKYRLIVLIISVILLLTYFFDPCHCRILLLYWTMDRIPPLIILFFSGSILWLYKEKIYWDNKICLILVLLSFAAIPLRIYLWLEPFTLPYILFWLAINLPFSDFDKTGDYSYGIYIYSFPIQQILAEYNLQQLGVGIYFLISFLLTMPLAIISWYLVEKPCLKLKNIKFDFIKSFLTQQ